MNQSEKLLSKLEKASGQTQQVIVLIFDVRGFTDFCKGEDSYNIANFVKRVYINILGQYFHDGDYYKPTGDGLLIVYNCPSGREEELTKSVIDRSMKLVKEFDVLCKR